MVSRRPSPGRRADAEAAAWIARLQSDARDESTEAALRAWLDADDDHRAAFERATEVWGMIPGAARPGAAPAAPAGGATAGRVAGTRTGRALALAAALALLLFGGWWLADRPARYATEHGEQEIATFEDGSRISLNTDTSLSVRYRAGVREVRLDHGEAMFEVAPDPQRPFIVDAGTKRVRALGTSFIVRRSGDAVTVVLIEGRVAVDDSDGAAMPSERVVMAPGERLQVAAAGSAAIDRPSLEAATAWRRGQAVFENDALADAVAEVNRYGGPRIVIDDPRIASLRVSGAFATNDSADFAAAVATLHGLRVERRGQEIRLVR